MYLEEIALDVETRDYFDKKFDKIGTAVHGLDMRVARMEERVNNGIVTSEVCVLRELGVTQRIDEIAERQKTLGKRMWAVIFAAVGGVIAAVISHVTK